MINKSVHQFIPRLQSPLDRDDLAVHERINSVLFQCNVSVLEYSYYFDLDM
jgi:hypothetical protein